MSDDQPLQQTPAQRVIEFFSTELALPPEQIDLTSRLRQDLGIDDADAADLMEAYALTFDIDISAFRINDYFGADIGVHPVLSHIMWLFGNSRPLKTLTVADCAKALETGRLP